MTKKYKLIITALLCLLIVFTFGACSGNEEETTTEVTTETTTKATTTAAPEPENINTLTGLADLSQEAIGKRPVAIMINNIKASLPQYGIYQADIMLETLVEGGITRMMALYGDITQVPKVCSVRSCRYYFPIFAHGFDAVYFCFGSNETLGTPTLKRIGIDYFDGNQTYDTLVFGRDSERLKKYSREHTAYVNGENIPELLEKYSVRTDYDEGKGETAFNFRSKKDNKSTGDIGADSVKLSFSGSYYSTFTYDKKSKTYLKQHNGKDHMDSGNNKQLAYTNLFVLEADIGYYNGGKLIEMDWSGGTGYYISYGKAQKITWTKTSESDSIKVYNAEGKEITVNAGKSYIGVIKSGCTKITENKTENAAAQ